MEKISFNLRWFLQQLIVAEATISNALEKSEDFSEHDKEIIDRVKSDIEMIDISLLKLLSPNK